MGRTKRRAPFDTASQTVRVEPLEEPQQPVSISASSNEPAADDADREDDDGAGPPG
ncbi:MAG: hypothetical protein JWQ20_4191 [Conexibacter sp.]|nr:hypothetical protein [Conexibacter sp.]